MAAPIPAITSSEPTDVGSDICLDLAFADPPCHSVVLCDKNLLAQRAEQLGKSVTLHDFQTQAAEPLSKGKLEVPHTPLDTECRAGELNPVNTAHVLRLLDVTYQGISDGLFTGTAAAPLHEGIISGVHAGNGLFSGHTGYLAGKSHTEQVVMMLTSDGLHVALVTIHLPLKGIFTTVMKPSIESVIRVLEHNLRHKFGVAKPVILVTGPNPHAGKGGHLGHEEINVIIPALRTLRAEGIDARDPYPVDTVFQPFLLKDAGAVLATCHDQDLPVLKYAGLGGGVNITLDLPFIHTSVDHGTALNLIGTDKTDSGSLMAVVLAAFGMAHDIQKQAI